MNRYRTYWLHALSPMHTGIGRGLGYIDLPIDRDGVTGWPIVRASALKGVLADHHGATEDARKNDDFLRRAFGRADTDNGSNAGALIPTDARLVCLPVRSFRGTFAWCTSPMALQWLARTLKLAGAKDLPMAPNALADNTAHNAENTVLADQGRIYLEELDFASQICRTATAWADWIARNLFPGDIEWQQLFVSRFLVIPDLSFDFLSETGTEVHTRVRISDESKTVERGALWTEECLPAESILAGLIKCDRVFRSDGKEDPFDPSSLLERFAPVGSPLSLQIGGKATVGLGQVRCVFSEIGG